MRRCFIALEIPAGELDFLLEKKNGLLHDPAFYDYRWEAPEKIHMTVKFLGDTPEEKIPDILEGLGHVTSKYPPLESRFTEFGLFYRRKEPKILWAGIRLDHSVFELVQDIETEMEKLGYAPEKRRFKPHLTLLRLKGFEKPGLVEAFEKTRIGGDTFLCNTITLFESKLQPSGSVYTAIETFKLEDK